MRNGLISILICWICAELSAQEAKDTSWAKVGGAVRTNTMYTIYEGETAPLPTENRHGIFWDTFRLEVDGYTRGLGFTFEYRFYPGFNSHFLKKGFLSYQIGDQHRVEAGITQVPFGMLPILGNSWWFQLPYYVGLEDDWDTGVKYRFQKDNWTFHAAYFLMAEPRGVSEPTYGSFMSARYSYDIIPEDGYNGNKERNQGNLRLEYADDNFLLGLSAQGGEVYNSVTENSGSAWAGALHTKYSLNESVNIKFQATHYLHQNVTSDSGAAVDYVNMGAYGFGIYQVADEASIFSIGLSYNIDLDWGPIESITFYEDYSYMHKQGKVDVNGSAIPYEPSQHNVLGFLVTAGSIYAYFDIASGINQPWLSSAFGGSALSAGRGVDPSLVPGADTDPGIPGNQVNPVDKDPPINTRFNINIGYYF